MKKNTKEEDSTLTGNRILMLKSRRVGSSAASQLWFNQSIAAAEKAFLDKQESLIMNYNLYVDAQNLIEKHPRRKLNHGKDK